MVSACGGRSEWLRKRLWDVEEGPLDHLWSKIKLEQWCPTTPDVSNLDSTKYRLYIDFTFVVS